MKFYYEHREEITLKNELLSKNDRITVPAAIRKEN